MLSTGISRHYLRQLKRDPLFMNELAEMEREISARFIEQRASAKEKLKAAEGEAADLCIQAVRGDIDGTPVPMQLRLKSAWDILDRTDNKAPEKKLVMRVDQLIVEAYKKRKEQEQEADDEDKSDS